MNNFKVWDKVKYINGNLHYNIWIMINQQNVAICRWGSTYVTTYKKIELVPDSNVSDAPENNISNSNNNNFMQYFNTVVLVMDNADTSMIGKYRELSAHSVRCAKDANDMRDTLVRELEKGIVTSDCKFLISPIF